MQILLQTIPEDIYSSVIDNTTYNTIEKCNIVTSVLLWWYKLTDIMLL